MVRETSIEGDDVADAFPTGFPRAADARRQRPPSLVGRYIRFDCASFCAAVLSPHPIKHIHMGARLRERFEEFERVSEKEE